MLTIVLTYRNRNIQIVKNCLGSIVSQTNTSFKVLLIDYGSDDVYVADLKKLVKNYPFVKLINCTVKGQLWNKSRAINIALKRCETPYLFVGDIDMLFHPEFVQKLESLKKNNITTYFQVGFLNSEESVLTKSFKDYNISFKSSEEATGMTYFSTRDLLAINGYDEFYHGWGSEDTDVHIRLKNAGKTVDFFNDEILLLHQWHPKSYRTKNCTTPFHTKLEQINSEYLKLTKLTQKTKANESFGFGIYNGSDYGALDSPDSEYNLTNKTALVKAFVIGVLLSKIDKVVKLTITRDSEYKSLKQIVKQLLGKKNIQFSSLEYINDFLLESIVYFLRNKPYCYKFHPEKQIIELTIKL